MKEVNFESNKHIIKVTDNYHKKIKIEAAKRSITINALVNEIMNFYFENNR